MIIKANPWKSVVWIVLAIAAIAALCVLLHTPHVSANTAVSNENDSVVPVTQPVENTPEPIEEITDDTCQHPNLEVTEPTETTVDQTKPIENEKPVQKPKEEKCECSHVWKDEYTPETETTEGTLIREQIGRAHV